MITTHWPNLVALAVHTQAFLAGCCNKTYLLDGWISGLWGGVRPCYVRLVQLVQPFPFLPLF